MSFFSLSEMAHNVDSKDMLSSAIQNKGKMRDFQRRGKIPRKWNEYCFQYLVRIVLSL